MKTSVPSGPAKGFSLVQALAVVVILGIIAYLAIPKATNIRAAAALTKLESDVGTVNQAIKVYLANGGILTDAMSYGVYGDPLEQKVIDKLKTRRNQFSADTFAGLKRDMIDKRLSVRLQTNAETNSNAPRAVWVPGESRFVIQRTGKGVREFYLNSELASLDYGIDEGRRSSAINVNDESGWIWAYDESNATSDRPGPTLIPMGGTTGGDDSGSGGDDHGSASGDDSADGTVVEIVRLGRPRITPRGGTYPKSAFPLMVTIDNPNPDDTWLMVSVNYGAYFRYEAPFPAEPNTRIRAYATGDPTLYESSSSDYAYYTTRLNRPSFSPSYRREYPMTDFPLTVTIRNYNDPSTWVMYSLDGGEFQRYSEPFTIEADTTVAAYVQPPDDEWEPSSTRTGTYRGYKVDLGLPRLYATATEFNETVSTILVTAENHPDNAGGSSQLRYAIVEKDAPPPDLSTFLYYLSPVATTYAQYPNGFTFYAYAESLNSEVWNNSALNSLTTSVDFFGVGVAQSTLFILDFSGSMDQQFFGSSDTRLQVVKNEMSKALGGTNIDENDRFGVLIFSSKPWWATPGGLVEIGSGSTLDLYAGTPENKTQIQSVVSATEDKRYTNFLRALQAVDQVQPPPEQIIFLTDGTPTVGDGSNEDLNNDWLAGLSEIVNLGIPVHTIGVDLKNQSRLDRLEYISEQTGGTSNLVGDPNLVPDSWEP